MEISRFPGKRLLRMPGSTTTRGQQVSCDIATGCVAFCWTENISAPNLSYAAQYLACALPCERFTPALAGSRASLGAGAVRYSFTVTDFHRLPFAGLPAHPSTHGESRQPTVEQVSRFCRVARRTFTSGLSQVGSRTGAPV